MIKYCFISSGITGKPNEVVIFSIVVGLLRDLPNPNCRGQFRFIEVIWFVQKEHIDHNKPRLGFCSCTLLSLAPGLVFKLTGLVLVFVPARSSPLHAFFLDSPLHAFFLDSPLHDYSSLWLSQSKADIKHHPTTVVFTSIPLRLSLKPEDSDFDFQTGLVPISKESFDIIDLITKRAKMEHDQPSFRKEIFDRSVFRNETIRRIKLSPAHRAGTPLSFDIIDLITKRAKMVNSKYKEWLLANSLCLTNEIFDRSVFRNETIRRIKLSPAHRAGTPLSFDIIDLITKRAKMVNSKYKEWLLANSLCLTNEIFDRSVFRNETIRRIKLSPAHRAGTPLSFDIIDLITKRAKMVNSKYKEWLLANSLCLTNEIFDRSVFRNETIRRIKLSPAHRAGTPLSFDIIDLITKRAKMKILIARFSETKPFAE
ncbi:hypothetical protein LXL04_032848 [Taraxacum kok-saghyz]